MLQVQASQIRAKHYFAYALLCSIWGSTWMAIRVVVRDVPPFLAAGLRFMIAAIILLAFALVKRSPWPRGKRQWRAIIVLSVTMIALPYGLLFWAEQHVTSSMTAVLYSSLPLMVALLTPVMTGKSVPRAAILSMMVALAGIAILFQIQLTASWQTLVGGVAVLISVLSSAFSSIYAKQENAQISTVVGTGLQLGIGSAFLLALSALCERSQAVIWRLPSMLALLFLATLGSAVAFAVYYWMLRHVQPYQIATISLVVPFVAILEGSLLLHEMITPMMFASAVTVLAAVAFVLRAESDSPTELNLNSETKML